MSGKARMEIAVYPLGTNDSSISKEVSNIFNFLDDCNLTYQVTTMGPIVEGTPDELFALARKIHDSVFTDSVKRVITTIKLDHRR